MGLFSEDTELLNALRDGDATAFDEIYALFFRQLAYFSERLTGSRVAAEDIAVDSFLKLLQKPPDLDSLPRLKAWLFAIVRNASLDYLKSEKRHLASHSEIKYLSPIEEDEIERNIIRSEALQAIYAEIENLPPQCRHIVKLTFVEGLSISEIASQMDLAYQTVRNQKARGIQLLRMALMKDSLLSQAIVLTCLALLEEKQVLCPVF